MEIRDYEDLKKKLCKELEEITKGSLGMGEIEAVDKLTHSIKSICYIIENMENEYSQYSRDGMWRANGSYRDGNSYNSYRNDSYANRRGTHYVRGHYSRAMDDVSEAIDEMMDDPNLSMDDKSTLRRARDMMRK